jgi:deoxyribodipyrimidine photolyase-related protein
MDIFILFPVHLFKNIDILHNKKIYLVEEPRYFTDFKYHKLKLAYHRATMKSYYDYLKNNNLDVYYINFNENYEKIKTSKNNIHIYDPCDNKLKNNILKYIPNVIIHETINFLINKDILLKKYNHQNFYKMQRKRLNILINPDGTPTGGKWSFDELNRKKIPESVIIPPLPHVSSDKYIIEAKIYVNKYFKNNYGSLDNFIYPITHNDSKKWLLNFLKNKFENFGKYEDAVKNNEVFLFHSVLTPMMNIGLLTDQEVIDITLPYQKTVMIESFEGFIRQIIGWRNYMYYSYITQGEKLRNLNFFNNKNNINKEIMWKGKTGILPIDNVIQKINEYSYAHHIERLMYLGNYMLLCMINPNDVYNIFMEWTIDAYDWVMVPNVYSMSQYADGGLIMTRPYLCSSNYILKMSNYKKDKWCEILDALYYNFINKNKKYLEHNYATSRQVAFWNKKSNNEKDKILKNAKKYLDNLNNF